MNRIGVGLAAALSLACATTSPRGGAAPVFYPPAPSPPRVQFLVAYSSEQDLGGGPGWFASFVVGKETVRKPIGKPYGVALQDGKLYVCDTGAPAIEILDLYRRRLDYFTPAGEGHLATPINIALDRDGSRYVADSARGQVLVFDRDGSYRGAIGTLVGRSRKAHGGGATAVPGVPPDGDDATAKPTDVLIAGNRVFVADLGNHCVRVHDKASREELFRIPRGEAGADSAGKLYAPTNLAMDKAGRLYVSDLGAFRVQQYDAGGTFLRSFGGGAGDRPGEFARPKGIAVDRENRLYVVDAAAQVVQVFDELGRLLMYFGERQGEAPGLDLPAKVIVDYEHVDHFRKYAAPGFLVEHLIIVTSQYGARKLSVFGFGFQQ